MSRPTISVINFTSDLHDADVQDAIRGVNRQIGEDFCSHWGSVWELRLHNSPFEVGDPDEVAEDAVRGEGVLYLVDENHLPGALGYHAINTAEIPYGFVFLTDPDEWTVTLSHEALELIIDPTVNVLVPGPDPRDPANEVLHAYEVCDAVERTSYQIDDIRVSNFITPQWFSPGDAPGTRNDFLGVGVPSFDATPNSHLAFFDFNAGWVEYLGGQMAGVSDACAWRQEAFDHDRKRLPEKTAHILSDVLQLAQKEPPKAARGRAARRALKEVRGITRSARKGARAQSLYDRMHR